MDQRWIPQCIAPPSVSLRPSGGKFIGWEEIHRVGRNSNRMGDSGILIKVILSFETVAKHKSVLCTKFKISFETLKHKSVIVFTNLFPQCNSLGFESTNCADLIAFILNVFPYDSLVDSQVPNIDGIRTKYVGHFLGVTFTVTNLFLSILLPNSDRTYI